MTLKLTNAVFTDACGSTSHDHNLKEGFEYETLRFGRAFRIDYARIIAQ